MIINPGFVRKRKIDDREVDRLPPGQYLESGFPVLSIGPTPIVPKDEYKLKVWGLCDPVEFSLSEIMNMKSTEIIEDIHCVTKWSKFDSEWRGVWLDTIIEKISLDESVTHILAHSSDGYTTNLPIEDVTEQKCLVAFEYDGEEIESSHGGPVRLVIPHLYFWKSAKWLSGIEFLDHEVSGFWEERGYHNYGDPWKEQRYSA